MGTIDSRMTPNAEYAEQVHERMERGKAERIKAQAQKERIHEQELETMQRQEQAKQQRLKAERVAEIQARHERKGANLDEMA